MGLVRNLSCAEIIAQVYFARLEANESSLPPLRNIVFMGMGEPLDNFSEVRKSIELLVDPRGMGFGPRYVTVSTVGPSPRAIRLMKALPVRVAWSIHAVDESVRRKLVPTTTHTMEELREAFLEVMNQQRDSLFVEITLIENLNDSLKDAELLAVFLKDFPGLVRVNLLPVNAGRAGMVPSGDEKVEAFRRFLQQAGYFCMVRRPRGQESMAACGQLAVSTLKEGRQHRRTVHSTASAVVPG
jgi:23S rRNA (adenine2503-C2)-methyltransferase